MKIFFADRPTYEQLKEITQLLEVETTTDKTLPKETWEKSEHKVCILHLGDYGKYTFNLYFDKSNEKLERVSIGILPKEERRI